MEANKKAFGEGTQTWGYHQMRIPEDEYRVLCMILPDLNSTDAEERRVAWQKFANSNLAEAYRLVQKPSKIKRSNKHKIIIN